jgi:hypothetical protein
VGFGSGPFGRLRFGEADWGRAVMFDLFPEVYRRLDAENSGLLEAWAIGLASKFRDFQKKIGNFVDLKDPSAVPTLNTTQTTVRLGQVFGETGDIVATGIDGTVDSFGVFSSPTARFSDTSVGYTLELEPFGSGTANTRYEGQITDVISSTSAAVDPYPSAGQVRWILRRPARTGSGETKIEIQYGDVSSVVPGALLWDGSTWFTVTNRELFTDYQTGETLLDKEGSDGIIDDTLYDTGLSYVRTMFTSTPFTNADAGKIISITSPTTANSKKYIIRNVYPGSGAYANKFGVNLLEMDLLNITLISDPTNTAYWAVLKNPVITIKGTDLPKGLVLKESPLGATAGGVPITLTDPSGLFDDDDVGRLIELIAYDAAAQPSFQAQQTSTVSSIASSTSISVPVAMAASASIYWRIRDQSGLSDTRSVVIYNPALIQFLADEFGTSLSQKDSDLRQRALVRHLITWASKKGTIDAYRIFGSLWGWTVTAQPLYKIDWIQWGGAAYAAGRSADPISKDSHVVTPLPAPTEDLLGTAGSSGSDGTLNYTSGFLTFTAPSAKFTADLAGYNLTVSDAAVSTSPLNKVYTIVSVPNQTTLYLATQDYIPVSNQAAGASTEQQWAASNGMTLPGPNAGVQTWRISRYYSAVKPAFPILDDFVWDTWNSDAQSTYPYPFVDWIREAIPLGFLQDYYVSVVASEYAGRNKWNLTFQDLQVVLAIENIPAQVGETITGATSGVTAVIYKAVPTIIVDNQGNTLVFTIYWTSVSVGTFVNPENFTGNLGAVGQLRGGLSPGPTIPAIAIPEHFNISFGSETYWIETTPVAAGAGPYKARVSSPTIPTAGVLYTFRYNSPAMPVDGLTADSVLSLTIHNVDSSLSLDEFLKRLEDVTPVHVHPIIKVV